MRINSSLVTSTLTRDNISNSAKQLAEFMKPNPDERRKIAELICSIHERLGKQAHSVLLEFTKAVSEGELSKFGKELANRGLPLSVQSELLALGQEMETQTREKLDELVLKAKRGAITLSKQALTKALVLLVV